MGGYKDGFFEKLPQCLTVVMPAMLRPSTSDGRNATGIIWLRTRIKLWHRNKRGHGRMAVRICERDSLADTWVSAGRAGGARAGIPL